MLVCWRILLKIERLSKLLNVDRFSFGNANMVKVYERLLSRIIPQGKNRDWFGCFLCNAWISCLF